MPRFELHTHQQDTVEEPGGLFAFTDSPTMAERWQRQGGLVVDTAPVR